MALDIVFMGTPDFSVPVLDAVVAAGHRVVAVYSQPPRPPGAAWPKSNRRCIAAPKRWDLPFGHR